VLGQQFIVHSSALQILGHQKTQNRCSVVLCKCIINSLDCTSVSLDCASVSLDIICTLEKEIRNFVLLGSIAVLCR